uniref:Uncharacterized protein n=1 Tax=Chromera velia CCMP2878 TaxID=1169474 RepID=A0A0G4HMD0_9ALVE|eukprot:Cvel_7519.t1-p1 / transcript=Cvel_7519.t1 / gene=Cvel_7519 / organism=Chromera_velia_CCMP2878 / gene_product=hypothetical protein / transcript_product=hypothetical protein / location=Cvel_scaffold395:23067-23372(-) / protein_length=102 / sequence_SO=supercontig / SO=protein_coding / is_pseudo=false
MAAYQSSSVIYPPLGWGNEPRGGECLGEAGEGKRTLCLGDGDLALPPPVGVFAWNLKIVFGSSLGGLRVLWALRGSGLGVEERTVGRKLKGERSTMRGSERR